MASSSETPNTERGTFGLSYFSDDLTPPRSASVQSVSIVASVVHVAALIDIKQKYVNTEKSTVEGIYCFPVDAHGAVTSFMVQVNGKIRQGMVKPYEEAKGQYIRALEQHRTTLLAVNKSKDLFNVNIGELEPGCQIEIFVSYSTELNYDIWINAIRFCLPKSLFPFYRTACADNNCEMITSPGNVKIKVNIAIQGSILSVENPSHNVNVTNIEPIPGKVPWTRAVVDLGARVTDMNRDFLLLITPEEHNRPRLYTEKIGDKSVAVMAHFIPDFQLDEQKVELILLLDRSSSMEGSRISLAQNALRMFLHAIPTGSYFNIVSFGSNYEFLFPESVQYNQANLDIASAHIQNLSANLGGTELLGVLKEVLEKPHIPGCLRHLFLLTDGQVHNTEEVIVLVKKHSHNSRVFSLGIGDSVSHQLISGVAKVGNGTSNFVEDNEQFDYKILDQLQSALQPSLTYVYVTWDGIPPDEETASLEDGRRFEQTPRKVPPLFESTQVLIFGIFDDKFPSGMSVHAQSPDGTVSIKIPVDEERDSISSNVLHKLAALKLIRELEMEAVSYEFPSLNKDQKLSPQQLTENKRRLREKIIQLSCTYGVTSRFTTYVIVDESKRTDSHHGMVQQRHIPLEAHGKNGECSSARLRCSSNYCEDQNQCEPGNECTNSDLESNIVSVSNRPCEGFFSDSRLPTIHRCSLGPRGPFAFSSCIPEFYPPQNSRGLQDAILETEEEEVVHRIVHKHTKVAKFRRELNINGFRDDLSTVGISGQNILPDSQEEAAGQRNNIGEINPVHVVAHLQSFCGSFPLSEEFAKAISVRLQDLKLACKKNGWDENGWATVLAVVFFTNCAPELKRSWELICIKANKWLVQNHVATFESMLTVAQNLLGQQ